jgi:hypothetical protein
MPSEASYGTDLTKSSRICLADRMSIFISGYDDAEKIPAVVLIFVLLRDEKTDKENITAKY